MREEVFTIFKKFHSFYYFIRLGYLLEKAVHTPTIIPSSHRRRDPLDGFDLEVERDQAEDEGLKILHQVVEHPEALRIRRLAHIDEGPNLRRLRKRSVGTGKRGGGGEGGQGTDLEGHMLVS